jgi:hypothetical protein
MAEGLLFGAPGEIRTPDQVVRSHLLYPAELRVLEVSFKCNLISVLGVVICLQRRPTQPHQQRELFVLRYWAIHRLTRH